MAGDWMKVEMETPDKPEVHYIAGALGIDPDAVFGKLFRVWSWFDKHTPNGNAVGVTYALVDRVAGVTGFGEAMAFVGWLKQSGHSLVLPNFDRHNGETAKKRGLTAKRVASHKKSNAEGNAKGNAGSVSDNDESALPREEKRREEEKIKDGADAPDPIFGSGLALLVRKGAKEMAARGFLGLLRKELKDDLIVAELLATAEAQDVSEPMAWLRAAAKTRAADKPTGSAKLDLRGVQ